MKNGKIVQVSGPVVDVEFEDLTSIFQFFFSAMQ